MTVDRSCRPSSPHGVVDWGRDGLLLMPATTHVGGVIMAAAGAPSPAVIYRAVAWPSSGLNVPRTTAAGALADPVGDTQAASPTI